MPRSISVIIVTWNALEHLQSFLPSVTETHYEDFEIIIADNASEDDSVDWIRKNYPECKIVTYTENFGYCGGNNRAVEYASGEILVFLNNDVETDPDWLTHIEPLFEDPQTSAVQPKIRSYKHRNEFEYAGAAGGFLDKLGYPFCRGRIFDTIEKDQGQYDKVVPLFWASGAAFAVRKEIFTELGKFDEDFRFHMEEIDFCWRLLNNGFTVRFAPESIVYHLGGGSLPMDSSRKTFYNFRNSLIMLWKNSSNTWLKKYFFPRLCMDGVAAFYAIIKGNFSDALAIFKAHIHFFMRWRQTHIKRRQLKNTENPDLMADYYIIFEYFIRGKKTYNEIESSRLNAK